MNIVDALVNSNMCISKAEARRCIAQGGVRQVVKFGIGGWNSEITDTIKSPDTDVDLGAEILVGVKRRFIVTE